jgi:hypothetical protein
VHFPKDENGDVLRRMAASGLQFDRIHDVDFFAIFRLRSDAELVAEHLVKTERTLVSVTTDTCQTGETELKVVRKMLLTHGNITDFEHLFGTLCAKYDGSADGWGVQ